MSSDDSARSKADLRTARSGEPVAGCWPRTKPVAILCGPMGAWVRAPEQEAGAHCCGGRGARGPRNDESSWKHTRPAQWAQKGPATHLLGSAVLSIRINLHTIKMPSIPCVPVDGSSWNRRACVIATFPPQYVV